MGHHRQPQGRPADVAWAIAVLWGLVLYQQINATNLGAVSASILGRVIGR